MPLLATELSFDPSTPALPAGVAGINVIPQNDGGSPTVKQSFYIPLLNITSINEQVGTTYTFLYSDVLKLVLLTNGSAIAAGLPSAATTGFGLGFHCVVKAGGAGAVTITPTTSTINGLSTLVLAAGQWALLWSDGTNYLALVPPSAGSTGTAVKNELVAFTGTSGTLAHTPITGTVSGYRNGQRMNPNSSSDYSIAGAAVTLTVTAGGSDVFLFDYSY